MAESVDALVSNTSGATHPGSIPGLGTKREFLMKFSLLLFIHTSIFLIPLHFKPHFKYEMEFHFPPQTEQSFLHNLDIKYTTESLQETFF